MIYVVHQNVSISERRTATLNVSASPTLINVHSLCGEIRLYTIHFSR